MQKTKTYNFNKKIKPLARTFFTGGLILFGSYQINRLDWDTYRLKVQSNQLQTNNSSLLKQESVERENKEYNILIGMGVFILFCLIILILITIWIKYFRKDDDE